MRISGILSHLRKKIINEILKPIMPRDKTTRHHHPYGIVSCHLLTYLVLPHVALVDGTDRHRKGN